MQKSIRRDLSKKIGVLIFCISIVIGIVFYSFSIYYHEKEFKNAIARQTKQLSDTFTIQLWLFDLNTTKELCRLFSESPEVNGLRLLDHKKKVVFEQAPSHKETTVHVNRELRHKGEKLVGYLDIYYTDSSHEEQRKNTFIIVILMVLGNIAGSFIFINILLKRYLSRPLEDLQKDMGLLAKGDFQQSDLVEQKTEIQNIIDTFNKLTVSLMERDEEVRKKTETLKAEVLERKKAEEELRRTKILLESCIESPKDMIILSLDREYRYLYFNIAHAESMRHVYGTRPKIEDCIFDHMKNKDDIKKVKEHYDRALSGEGHVAIEEYGEVQLRYYYEIRYNPVYNQRNEIIGVTSFAQNITERKQAEEALRKSEQENRLILNNMSDYVWVLDLNTLRVAYVSPVVEKILGYSPDEMKALDFDAFFSPETTETVNGIIEKEISIDGQDGVDPDRKIAMELEILRKDGSEVWTEISFSLLRDNEGKPTSFIGITRDITERKQRESQFQQAQKMEAIATLAGGVAHEFNNTLMGIMGNIELLQMNLSEDEGNDKYLETMKSAGHRMSHLTAQLLAYAEGGKYQPKDLKMDDFVIETLPILQHELSLAVRVETHFQKDISFVNADNAQMQMVLSAVLTNSNEAIEDEGIIRITAENKDVDDNFANQHAALKRGPYVCLTVEDDGRGMDEETRNGIFEPFFTTKFQGRGMGMAAVHGIVRNHDGWISVDSELGRGTTVRIYLPAIEVETKKPKETKVEVATGTGTILMIEDEEVVIEVTQAMLEMLGYRVMVAKTGKDAIHIAETFDGQIDLALLDIKLPDIDGRNLYPLIMKARSNLKVVVFSGYSIDGPAREILDAGAQDFIQKPFSIATLSEKLKEVLEGK